MKTPLVGAILFSIAANILAQTASSVGSINQTPASETPQDTPFSIVQRDANSSTWQRTTYEQLPSGDWIPHIHSYAEVATGLNFQNPDTGQWETSSEEIEMISGGAVAKHGQHKVIFAADLATVGAIDMETPGGQRLQSHMLGLAYFDKASGQTVFIAEVTNSIGQLISTNEVWYDNAFTGIKAGVRYTYTREGFEQDVILEAQPPAPEIYGLNSSTTILQAYTEFLSPPAPVISMGFISAGAGEQLLDKTLSFPSMKIGRGRAFLMGNSSQSVAVAKDWTTVEGRQFLIEEVPISQISEQLQSLPPAPTASMRFSNSVVNVVASKRLTPETPMANAGKKQMKMASLSTKIGGFVLDYASLITSQTNQIFRADTTYFVSGNANLYGTNTVFEGGTVIKYASGASLNVNTPVDWRTGVYRPVVMLAKDDNTIGENISGSTGNPGSSYYAAKALYFDGTSALTNLNIQNLRVLNANAAVVINGRGNHVLTDVQLINCADGVAATNTDFSLRNALLALVRTNFTGSSATGRVEHLTSDTAIWLNSNIGTNLFLTNCLLSAVTNLGSCFTQSVATVTSSNGVFQAIGGASYYLANNTYRDAGTTNINSTLRAQLGQKTTYPPVLCLNSNFNTVTTLSPQVPRDTDIPDLGYHYDPLDYVFSGVVINTNVTIAAGTSVGWFKQSSGSPVLMSERQILTFDGRADAQDYFIRTSTAQEGNGQWVGNGAIGIVTTTDESSGDVMRSPEIHMNFTTMAVLIWEQQFRDTSGYLIVRGNNSTLAGGNTAGYDISYYLTNCLIDNQQIGQVKGLTGNEVYLRNCTLHNGAMYYSRAIAIPVSVRDCVFDGISLSIKDGYWATTNTDYDYNAYTIPTNSTRIAGIHDANTVSFNWQTGPLGRFYLPTNSVLIDAGHTNANLVGLYHFTTQTNQVKETNSFVDIGYHYVALSTVGSPIDTDGDGLPDYLEDANGDGIYDTGDPFDWKNADADGSGGGAATFSNGTSLLILEPKPTSQIP